MSKNKTVNLCTRHWKEYDLGEDCNDCFMELNGCDWDAITARERAERAVDEAWERFEP